MPSTTASLRGLCGYRGCAVVADADARMGVDRTLVTSAFLKEALDKGAGMFKWEERKQRSGQRVGNKVTGIGVGQGYHSAGTNGFDGLVRITPDGKLHVHTGVGNLGTYSYSATSRVAAELLNYSWDNVVIERGDSRRGLPWNSVQAGSLTSSTQSRTNYVAAMDARQKLLDIAAQMLGGAPADYELGAERVVSKADASKSIRLRSGGPEGDRAGWQVQRQADSRRSQSADRRQRRDDRRLRVDRRRQG